MSKRFIREHLAADLRNQGLWDPATMTEDQAEAATSKVTPRDVYPRVDPTALLKLPVPSDIFLPSGFPSSADDQTGSFCGNTAEIHSEAPASRASAVDLLRALAPEGPWTVRTISSLGGAPRPPKALGCRVGPSNSQDLKTGLFGWIDLARTGKNNCYLHVAVGSDDKPKLARHDVIGARAVWTDIDPGDEKHPVTSVADFNERRAVILAAMQAEQPPFSCIVDSGNGYQGYKFVEPYRVDGDPARLAMLEAVNLAISDSVNRRLEGTGLRADKCHSADHLMRLPDTTNFLTAKKRLHGYPEGDRRARIVLWHPERVYKIEELPTKTHESNDVAGRDTIRIGCVASITADQLKTMLSGLDPRDFREGERWRSLLWACHHGTAGAGRDVFVAWSASDEQFAGEAEKTGKVWDRANDERSDAITVATLFHELKEAGREDLVQGFRSGCGTRARILYDETMLPDILDEVEAALIVAQTPIYQTGGRVVHPLRLDTASDEEGVRRSAGALLLRNVSALRYREYYLTHISFTRMKTTKSGARIEVPYAPPVSFANHYLAREDKWRVPVISGIIETPTLRADGSLLESEGFDKDSGLLADFNGVKFPSIPIAPSKEQATAALAIIKELLVGFPFVPDDESAPERSASRSVALSAILTGLVRRTLRSAPLHGFSAPTMGTGKTLLCDVVSMIGAGRLATAMSQGHDETEDEKRLLGVLMRGDLLLVIDNVHRPICGDTLCTIMTQQTWQGRLLGENRQVHVPTNVLILATGNNLTVAGDMTTRTLLSRLDAGIEQPESRRFDVDLKEEIPRRRPELVVAGLTLLRAFIAAGRPGFKDLEPYGRFEDWSNLIRGALVWLGEPDPCNSRSFIAERDPVRADLGAVVAAWHACIGDGVMVTAQDIITRSTAKENTALARAISAVLPREVTPKGLTGYLSDYNGRIIDGRCIRLFPDKHLKVARFRLDEVVAPESQETMPF